jgi:carboxymethylenebutenolidase
VDHPDTHHGPVRAWQALPDGTPQGGLVVVQEIFGANPHIRSVAERFAAEGYAVLAPSFFDLIDGQKPIRMPCPTTPTA